MRSDTWRCDFQPVDRFTLDRLLCAPHPASPPKVFPDLAEREEAVLRLIAQDLNNAEIATKLGLSLKTVRNHVSNVFSKLQVADRAQAIIRAREAGLGRN